MSLTIIIQKTAHYSVSAVAILFVQSNINLAYFRALLVYAFKSQSFKFIHKRGLSKCRLDRVTQYLSLYSFFTYQLCNAFCTWNNSVFKVNRNYTYYLPLADNMYIYKGIQVSLNTGSQVWGVKATLYISCGLVS